jgi:hypothetical protein
MRVVRVREQTTVDRAAQAVRVAAARVELQLAAAQV